MTYFVIKAVHITAVVVWMAGMMMAPVFLRTLSLLDDEARKSHAPRLRSVFRAFNTPAMLTALSCGIFLMIRGGWLHSYWLYIKLGVVTLLFGMHGYYSRRLRELNKRASEKASAWSWFPPATVIAVALIVFMVVLKPV